MYISDRDDNLLATPQRSIDQYHDNVTRTIAANNESIIQNCPSGQNSNYKSCFNCPQYFNVYTLRCDSCPNDQFNPNNRTCLEKKKRYSNLNDSYWTANNISRVI